jgi:(E)-4-hydroxy-3-methylbut-2-enyl-diphosphate synthase
MLHKILPARWPSNLVFENSEAASLLVQSMIVSATTDTEAALAEIKELAEAGAGLVRLTVQSRKVAESLEPLRKRMTEEGLTVALAADIHFSPEAAMLAADFVEKIRINPGNFADKKRFENPDYSDEDYAAELARVEEVFTPLVEKCKRLGRVMRIGINHGSLSDRLLARYGDTPRGMAESAFEYLRIAEKLGYHDIVISMKASNVRVMIDAYRLLALEMLRRSESGDVPVYPIHLGVTEAGEGEDARMKSYIGMASLLEYGIGDTLRVSLTEDPVHEMPACRALANRYNPRREDAEPWTASTLVAAFEAAGSDAKTGALPAPAGPLDPAERHPVTLVPVDGWTPELDRLLDMPWGAHAPDHVLTDPAPEGLVRFRPDLAALSSDIADTRERAYLDLAISAGVPLLEGRARAIAVEASSEEDALEGCRLAFALLQTTRLRMSRADFIACPSCGRTHFDLQETTKRIKERFAHLPGVKIAVMGCIVNGPGEMADADFGYVGAAPGKIDLYEGHRCVEKNLPSDNAVDRLQLLIKSRGLWRNP